MARRKKPGTDELLARMRHLETLRLKLLDSLESIAESGGFRRSPDSFQSPLAVLRDTGQRVMKLAPFSAAALWMVIEPTSDFELGWCEPEIKRNFMAREFEHLTAEGIVSLALKSERPVMAAGSEPELRHVVQVLTTRSRIRGLLVAHVEGYDGLPDGTLPLINVLCQSAAASLEGLELYRLLRERNTTLEAEMKARMAVQARQELLSQAFHNSLEGMMVMDGSGKILDANPALLELTKSLDSGVVGMSVHSLLARIGARRHYREIATALETQGRFKGEITARNERNETFHIWLSVNTVRNASASVGNFVAVLHAMVGRKELENALALAEFKFRDIFEHAPVAIFRTTIDGRFLDVNPAYAQILGYASPDEILHSVSDIRKQLYVDASQRDAYIKALLEHGAVKDFEVRLRCKDGREILVSMNTRAVRNEAGKVASFNGFLLDITALRRAEEEKERLKNKLHQAQKLQSVGRLAGGVAHDFNNMLGVIIGQAQLALMKIPSGDPMQSRLLEIEKAAQRSAGLVNQLLAFARKQTVVPRFVDINESITDMLKMLKRLAGQNVQIVWRPGDHLWPVRIDPSQLDQILINLVVNAGQAIEGAGTATISTHNVLLTESDCQRYDGILPGEYVLLTVEDTGCGMDQVIMDQIFEPFFTTKDVGQGTGLGLATVYGIARQNHGWVTVDSEIGRGSEFNIYLPRATPDKPSVALEPTFPIHESGTPATVLLVNDDRNLAGMIQETLTGLGHSVLVSQDPWEALRVIRNQPYPVDLLVTDLIMPEMSGKELAERMHALAPDMKCLFLADAASGLPAGQEETNEGTIFLRQPFTSAELAQAIRQAFDRSGYEKA